MQKEMAIAIIAAFVTVCGILFIFSIIPDMNQSIPYTKNVIVYQTFPREDSYMYHTPPYFTTMEGEIYDVNDDLLWAKLHQNETVTISWKYGASERRTGTVVDIVFT